MQQLQNLQQLQRFQQVPKSIIVTNKHYREFSEVKNAIFYLDPPYEHTIGYDEKTSRKVSKLDKKTYLDIRQELLTMPRGSTVEKDDFICKLGMGRTKNRMYYKDLRAKSTFDSQAFYDLAYEMSKQNIVIVSSYAISDRRFNCVFEFESARCTLQSGVTQNKNKVERLFMVKQISICSHYT